MDILIKGINLPRYGDLAGIEIRRDGKVYESDGHFSYEIGEWKTLPSHGDLVDITPIRDKMSRIMNRYDIDDWGGKLADLIENAETIVEASNGTDS